MRALVTVVVTGTVAATTVALAPAAAASPAVDLARPAAVVSPATERLASFDSQMLSLINGARSSAGVPALRSSGGLASLAVWWSQKMATGATGYQLAHNPNAWSMCASYGASNRTAWAENVAAFSNGASASAVFNAYMASPGHRANILNGTYRYVGIGTVSGSKGSYNTMEFTDLVDGASAPAPKPAPTSAPKPTPTPKPAPTSAPKPAPTSVKPAPSKATTPPPAPATSATSPRRQADAQRGADRTAPARPAAPTPSHGTLLAAFGALPAAGVTVSIRGGACTGEVSTATTGRNGRASVSVTPGSYCAVAVSVPRGVHTPDPVRFTVRAGHDFRVTLNDLDAVTVWWRTRGTWLALPI